MKTVSYTIFTLFVFMVGFICPAALHAQDADTSFSKNEWHDFEGTLGDSAIQMALYVFDDDSIQGNYVFKRYEVKIPLSGHYHQGTIELREYLNNTVSGYFKSSRWQTYTSNICEGTWTAATGDKTVAFNLTPTDEAKGSYGHRYAEFTADTVLENFARKIKYAVLKGDKDWVADNVSYPIDVHFHYASESTPKSIEMKNKKVFLDKYDMIFNTAFKNRIRNDVPCNLWGSYMGYMLGNGDIWINPNGNKVKITSINN